ncbi:MAG: metalloregulator ArsR/SmtB family transcription factor [Pseudomonadota bacterium]
MTMTSTSCIRRLQAQTSNLVIDKCSHTLTYSHMAIHYETPLDRTFHALGDGTRRQILAMLATKGALSANELRAPFDVAQPTVSKHLKVLEQAGLISRSIEGRKHRFRLEATRMNEAEDWIARHREFWEGTLKRLEAFVHTMEAPGNDE